MLRFSRRRSFFFGPYSLFFPGTPLNWQYRTSPPPPDPFCFPQLPDYPPSMPEGFFPPHTSLWTAPLSGPFNIRNVKFHMNHPTSPPPSSSFLKGFQSSRALRPLRRPENLTSVPYREIFLSHGPALYLPNSLLPQPNPRSIDPILETPLLGAPSICHVSRHPCLSLFLRSFSPRYFVLPPFSLFSFSDSPLQFSREKKTNPSPISPRFDVKKLTTTPQPLFPPSRNIIYSFE